jgi:hypothetical protein
MKKHLTFFLLVLGYGLTAQQQVLLPTTAHYQFPNKTSGFAQEEWLAIMSDMANDTFLLNRMKGLRRGPITVNHLPYVCYVNFEHKVMIDFCPECNWIITDYSYKECESVVSIRSDEFGFHLKNIQSYDTVWQKGDTVKTLLFILTTPGNDECILTPFASKEHKAGFPVYPLLVRRKAIRK